MGLLTLLGSGVKLLRSFGNRNSSLEDKVSPNYLAVSDSGLNLGDTNFDFKSSKNLYRVAKYELSNANGNLAGKVYDFMKQYIFSADNIDYRRISDAVDYFNELSIHADGEAKKAVETALTVIQHLNDYLIRQFEREDESSSQGFKNYLFGERGVLTQKRLNDMRKASDILSRKKSDLEERKNYKIGKDNFEALNASYTKDSQGRIFVNVNDDNSLGMYSQHGKLYWNVFDKMFDDSEGKIDTRKAVTKYAKRHISNLNKEGKVDYIESIDWKKNDYRDYARFKY